MAFRVRFHILAALTLAAWMVTFTHLVLSPVGSGAFAISVTALVTVMGPLPLASVSETLPRMRIFPILTTRHELRGTVGDWMSRRVVTAEAHETIQRVYTLIMESGFTAFPVVSRKQLVGIVSRHDLLRAGRVRKALSNPAHVEVESVMTTEIVTIGPGAPTAEAAALLVKHDISRMPVVEAGKIVGIIDRHDLLKGLVFKH
jgi:CBS domain-containing protein